MEGQPRLATAAKPGLLFSSENGYTFREAFLPVIRELARLCRIDVVLSEALLNEQLKQELHELEANQVIAAVHLTYTDRKQKESLHHYHKRLQTFAHSLGGLQLDMIVLGGDFQIAHRYLLNQFPDPRITKVVLQGGLNIRVLEAYRRAKGLDVNGGAIISKPIDPLLRPLRFLKKRARALRMDFRQWQNHYLVPYWQHKKVFPLTGYERLAFAAGICEHVICYDPVMKETLQTVNPLVQQVHVARHPLDKGNGPQAFDRTTESTGRLLVMFAGNVATEMGEEKINRWVEVTRQVIRLKDIGAIDLRFHPRSAKSLQWPRKMNDAMTQLGCQVNIVDAAAISFDEHLGRYVGMIGSPSAAMRIARALNKSMFIIGLANCSDGDLYDQSWAVGEGEGIHWVWEGEAVTAEQLQPPRMAEDQRPTVVDILLKLLPVGSSQ